MKVKSVEYAYPSSIIAARFKMSNGCWTVQVGEQDSPLAAISAHNSRESAMFNARMLDLPWLMAFRLIHPADAALPLIKPEPVTS